MQVNIAVFKSLTFMLVNSSTGLTSLRINFFKAHEADGAITWWGQMQKNVFQVIQTTLVLLVFIGSDSLVQEFEYSP